MFRGILSWCIPGQSSAQGINSFFCYVGAELIPCLQAWQQVHFPTESSHRLSFETGSFVSQPC